MLGANQFSTDIGIDLGTANVLVYVKGRGIVVDEPSVVAVEKDTRQLIAIGKEARAMLGRTPGHIEVIRPLRGGIIADYDAAEELLRYVIGQVAVKSWFFKPRVMICIPTDITGVQSRAVKQAAMQAGAGQVYLIEEPVAAALGAGLNIVEANGNMVVDIGGGATNIAVLSYGGIVASTFLRIGGDTLDDDIIAYVRKHYDLCIGDLTAERLKMRIGSAFPQALTAEITMTAGGLDRTEKLPKAILLSSREIHEAIAGHTKTIAVQVRELLDRTPPELTADILDRGIILTGGGALLNGMDLLISRETGISAWVADDAVSCVALGTGKSLLHLKDLQKTDTFSPYSSYKRFEPTRFTDPYDE